MNIIGCAINFKKILISLGRTPSLLDKLAAEIQERGGQCVSLQVDHSNDKEVKELFEKIEKDENGKLKGYGNYVRLKHEDGTFSEYGHLNDLSVFGNVNDKSEKKPSVKKGDVIGYVGDTGDSTNPHLHYTRKDKNRKSFPPPQQELDDLLDNLNQNCKK